MSFNLILKDEIVKKPINKKAFKRKKKKVGLKFDRKKPMRIKSKKKISQTKTNFN
jgi:hypothetical protein